MAFWDAITKLSKVPVIGSLGNALGNAVTNAKVNAYTKSLAPTPAVTTPAQRAAMAPVATPKVTPPPSNISYKTSYSGGSSSLPDYNTARNTAQTGVSSAYDPLRKLLENEINKGIPGRYAPQIETAKGQLPLNQRKYESMLSLLEQSTGENKTNILGQEDTALGAERARAGARGLYDSSVLAGGEQRIAKDAMTALTENERNRQLKAEGYNTDYKTSDQAVYDYLASLYNQQGNEIAGVKSQLAGIPADMLGGTENYLSNMMNYDKTKADVSKSYASDAVKGDYMEYTDENGDLRQGYFQNGQLVQDMGEAVPNTADTRQSKLLSNLLQKYLVDNVLSPEEASTMRQKFPWEQDNIDKLEKQYSGKKTGFLGLW